LSINCAFVGLLYEIKTQNKYKLNYIERISSYRVVKCTARCYKYLPVSVLGRNNRYF